MVLESKEDEFLTLPSLTQGHERRPRDERVSKSAPWFLDLDFTLLTWVCTRSSALGYCNMFSLFNCKDISLIDVNLPPRLLGREL